MTKLEQTDEVSVQALHSGDKAEFAKLVDLYSAPIYRLALKILNDPQDAEDVLQETFLKAYRALPQFEGRSSLSTWLHRIAVNEALMLVRRRNPNVVSVDQEVETAEGELEPVQVIDWCCLPENELLSGEARQMLDAAVAGLPLTLRVVFVLRDIQGLSIKETAEALDLSETAVKTRLMRARLRLRETLSAYFGKWVPERPENDES